MTLPGAGPPTAAERALAALKSQSVNTARGEVQTRSAARRAPTAPYHAPAGGGTLTAGVQYQASSPALTSDWAMTDLNWSHDGSAYSADPGPFFTLDSGDVSILAPGVYQAAAACEVSGGVGSAGEEYRLQLVVEYNEDFGNYWDSATEGASLPISSLTATSLPYLVVQDDIDNGYTLVRATVIGPVGSAATVSSATITVVRFT